MPFVEGLICTVPVLNGASEGFPIKGLALLRPPPLSCVMMIIDYCRVDCCGRLGFRDRYLSALPCIIASTAIGDELTDNLIVIVHSVYIYM